eukprot:3934293-Rhodomonas_salina.1
MLYAVDLKSSITITITITISTSSGKERRFTAQVLLFSQHKCPAVIARREVESRRVQGGEEGREGGGGRWREEAGLQGWLYDPAALLAGLTLAVAGRLDTARVQTNVYLKSVHSVQTCEMLPEAVPRLTQAVVLPAWGSISTVDS